MSIATRRDFLKTLGAAAALSASSLHASIPVVAAGRRIPAYGLFPESPSFW